MTKQFHFLEYSQEKHLYMYTKGLITRPFITDVTRRNAQPPNAHQKVNGQINFGTFIL